MNPVLAIASKEIRDGMRNRWVVAATLVLAALALGLAFMGSAPTGTVGVSRLAVTVVSLASLTIFLVPLIALLLSFDSLVGEIERGSMLLLLSYPVGRGQVVWGKFLGHLSLLSIATVLGYGAAGLGLALTAGETGPGDWAAFATLVASSILLGACFLAIGLLASALVRERATAAGLAVGVWLVFVLLFDLGLLGFLAATEGRGLSAEAFRWVLLLNPADAFRLLNLTGFADTRNLAGMAGLGDEAALPLAVLVAALAAWVLVPMLATHMVFARRPLAILLLVLLAACGDDRQAAAPPPAAMTAEAVGHYCGMALTDHPGPKGQVQVKSRKPPYWFSSARDTLAFTMLPEEPKDIVAIYVTAMDKAKDWNSPGAESWVDARAASYVVGSDATGGMGQREVVPFSTPEAAQAFASRHGGTVSAFEQVPRDMVLGEDTPAAQAGKHDGSHK